METILIYRLEDYPENGGGLYYKTCIDAEDAINEVNKLNMQNSGKLKVEYIGDVLKRIQIEVVEKVTQYAIKE